MKEVIILTKEEYAEMQNHITHLQNLVRERDSIINGQENVIECEMAMKKRYKDALIRIAIESSVMQHNKEYYIWCEQKAEEYNNINDDDKMAVIYIAKGDHCGFDFLTKEDAINGIKLLKNYDEEVAELYDERVKQCILGVRTHYCPKGFDWEDELGGWHHTNSWSRMVQFSGKYDVIDIVDSATGRPFVDMHGIFPW